MKRLLLLAALLCAAATTRAQMPEVPEPDFIGEVVAVLPDGSTAKLEKETVQMRTRANAGVLIVGIGKAKTKSSSSRPQRPYASTASSPSAS